jgi:hypothetical protein
VSLPQPSQLLLPNAQVAQRRAQSPAAPSVALVAHANAVAPKPAAARVVASGAGAARAASTKSASVRKPQRRLSPNLHSSPPPPPALREWLATKHGMQEYLVQRVELEHVERAARLLLAGDSGREPDPIVVDAVAAILERIAEHACALEFGVSGDQRVDAAEALEDVQALLVKRADPRRADFVELVRDYTARLRRLGAGIDEAEARAIVQAFLIASTRLDRAFRRLDEAYVREHLASLCARRAKPDTGALAAVAGAMSAKVGAFSDRNVKRAISAFDRAWQRRAQSDKEG